MKDACYVTRDGVALKSDLLFEIDSGKVEDIAGESVTLSYTD